MDKSFYTNVGVRGPNVLYRGYKDGARVQKEESFIPTLFVPSVPGKDPDSGWTDIHGNPISPIKFRSMLMARKFVEEATSPGLFQEFFGNTRWEYQYIAERFPGEIHPDTSLLRVCHIDIEVASENGFSSVADATEDVLLITAAINDGRPQVFVNSQYGDVMEIEGADIHRFPTEAKMLGAFLVWWRGADPDIVTGWNVKFYDIPYLVHRLNKVLGPGTSAMLSPWNMVRDREEEFRERTNLVYDIHGVATMDYLQLYLKFTFTKRESYKLDYIAHVELDERKVKWDDKYDTMRDFYRSDYHKFAEYNVVDVDLVRKLEGKLKLLELTSAIAYNAKVNITDVLSQVRTWDQIIFHHLHDRKIAIPQKGSAHKSEQYAGAYVKDPVPGVYEWIISFDLNSLYPHLIMQYGISPDSAVTIEDVKRLAETATPEKKAILDRLISLCRSVKVDDLIDGDVDTSVLKEVDLSMAANGTLYRRDKQGFLPHLMERMYKDRKAAKKRGLAYQKLAEAIQHEISERNAEKPKDRKDRPEVPEIEGFDPKKIEDTERLFDILSGCKAESVRMETRQMALKVQLNSAYGALGSEFFRYFSVDMAVAITLSGQLSIRWVIKRLNAEMNRILGTEGKDYIIASDTDSVYINMKPLVDRVLPGCTNKGKIVDFLDKAAKQLGETIDAAYASLADKMNAFQNKMVMEREVIADVGFWTAKKRYALNVWDSEGVRYEKPKRKIKGLETARSSTPEMVQVALKKCIDLILTGSETALHTHVAEFKAKFMSSPPEAISKASQFNGAKKYADPSTIWKSGTPAHVKGGLIYNQTLRDKGLDRKYPRIEEGEKIKFAYLKEPNPVGQACISFPGKLPKELALERYIDYTRLYETLFLNPLESITNLIGWHSERKNTLDHLFE